jgi:transcriptional regulator with XRE-family HTH domain
MLSATLTQGLANYSIGEKLHSLRMRKKLGLVELGRHTGLSSALLSKLERGKLFPTLPTLLRIAMVFSVGLDHFFTEEKQKHHLAVVRKSERQRFPERPNTTELSYYFESLDFPVTDPKLNAYIAEFCPVPEKNARPHQHAGAELIYILRGRMGIKIGGTEHVLGPGDSMYFDSSIPHSYRRLGRTTCDAVVVTAR